MADCPRLRHAVGHWQEVGRVLYRAALATLFSRSWTSADSPGVFALVVKTARTLSLLAGAAVTALGLAGGSAHAKDEGPISLVATGGVVWITHAGGTVQRVDAASGRTIGRRIRVGYAPNDIVTSRTAVWVANFGSGGDRYAQRNGSVTRLDRKSGKVVATIRLPRASAMGLAATNGALWVIGAADRRVFQIDIERNRVVRTLTLPGRLVASSIAAADGRIAVSVTMGRQQCAPAGTCGQERRKSKIVMIDPKTARVGRAHEVGAGPDRIALLGKLVWMTNAAAGTVTRLDPARGKTVGTPIAVGPFPHSITIGRGTAWVSVSSAKKGRLVAIDVGLARIRPLESPFSVNEQIADLAASGTSVWVLTVGGVLFRLDSRTGKPNFRKPLTVARGQH